MKIKKLNWSTGRGAPVKFEKIVNILTEEIKNGAKIFIGTDSFSSRQKCTFASAICIHGKNSSGRYFFARDNEPVLPYKQLVVRLTEEVRRTIEIASVLNEDYNISSKNLELHLDVSPFHLKNGTSKFSDMLRGYVSGAGFYCRIKPNAWASQSVADKHSK